MATLLNGRELALNLRKELKEKIATSKLTPHLGVLLVGDDPASHLYVSLKEQAAKEVGIVVEKVLLPATATTEAVIACVQTFNQRSEINGILIQLPLPPNLDEHQVIAALNPEKDADGFHPDNLAHFLSNQQAIVPGVSAGIMKLIELAQQHLSQKNAYLLVNSDEFAQPLKKLLSDAGAKVQISREVNIEQLSSADIIVVALGKPKTITSSMIKDGAIIIDVGTTKVDNKVLGDVQADGLAERPIFITPVPGGVGPMTVAMLLWNVYELTRRQT